MNDVYKLFQSFDINKSCVALIWLKKNAFELNWVRGHFLHEDSVVWHEDKPNSMNIHGGLDAGV